MGLGHDYCDVNCGATECTGTWQYAERCKHDNGWHVAVEVKILWLFTVRKTVFVCSDCGESMPSNADVTGLAPEKG